MFFSISKKKEIRFPVNLLFENIFINLDEGWDIKENNEYYIIYKGYIEENLSIYKINIDSLTKYFGNFCAIFIDKITHEIKIRHGIHRSFKLFINDNDITNIPIDKEQYKIIQPNYFIDIKFIDSKVNFKETMFNIISEINIPESIEEKIVLLKNLLLEKINFFIDKNIKKRLYLSGGVDTTLLYSIIKYLNYKNIEIVLGEHFEPNYFYCKNYEYLRTYWCYNQLHNWEENSLLLTGAYGDEYTLRSPYTISAWCSYYNINLFNYLKPNDHHYLYFSRDSSKLALMKFFKQKINIKNLTEFIIKENSNDYQHWHFNKTITWTPFLDNRITQIILSFPKEYVLGQICDSMISKMLIKIFDEDSLKLISNQKNYNAYENLVSMIQK